MSLTPTYAPDIYVSGTTPMQIDFQATTTAEVGAGGTITIASSAAIWAAADPVTCAVQKGGSADSSTFASGTAASDESTFVATVQSSQSVGAGVAVVFACSSNLAPLEGAGLEVSFTFASSADADAVADVAGWNPVVRVTGTMSMTFANGVAACSGTMESSLKTSIAVGLNAITSTGCVWMDICLYNMSLGTRNGPKEQKSRD